MFERLDFLPNDTIINSTRANPDEIIFQINEY